MNTAIAIDPIEAIDRAYTQGIDTWEAMVALGSSDEEDMGIKRWRQGDLAMRVEKRYGDKTLSKYADAIGVIYSTLKQRWEMSRYYEPDTRVSYPLFYSHYRQAKRFEVLERSLRVLNKAALRDWPVWKLQLFIDRCLGKDRPSRESAEGEVMRAYQQDDGRYLVIRVDIDIKTGQIVTIRVK